MNENDNQPGGLSAGENGEANLNHPGSQEKTPPGSYTGQPDDLHDLFGSVSFSASDEEDPLAALRNDPNYAALIRDLEYIASQARLLFSNEEAPRDEVWDEISKKLKDKPEEEADA
jgi:hypothetical protein